MAENYVERISYNQTHIFIDEFDDKILFTGEDINSLVQERIQSFIQQKNSDERVKEIAQEVLDVEESEVEEEINSLGATESAQRLDRIVEKMKENGIEPEGYGRLGWRSQMSKYKLTSKAVKIIEKIQENK